MKVSQLNHLIQAQQQPQPEIDAELEVPSIQYEQLDQLRCYVDLAVLFEEEYISLLNAGKEQFLTNYENIDDVLDGNRRDLIKKRIGNPWINIGLDLPEFLQNCMILQQAIPGNDLAIEELECLFKYVCENAQEITQKFVCLLLFFELVEPGETTLNVERFKYACELLKSVLTSSNSKVN